MLNNHSIKPQRSITHKNNYNSGYYWCFLSSFCLLCLYLVINLLVLKICMDIRRKIELENVGFFLCSLKSSVDKIKITMTTEIIDGHDDWRMLQSRDFMLTVPFRVTYTEGIPDRICTQDTFSIRIRSDAMIIEWIQWKLMPTTNAEMTGYYLKLMNRQCNQFLLSCETSIVLDYVNLKEK